MGSMPPAEVTRFFRVAPMSWDDVMADRIARGLEKAPKVRTAKAPKVDGPRMLRFLDAVGVSTVEIDARDPRNNRPCTAPRHVGGPPKSAAGALKLRRSYMAQCECRLCALAMFPARTFAEHEAFGLSAIRAEHDASPFGKRGPSIEEGKS